MLKERLPMNDFEAALPARDYNEVIGALNPSQNVAATSAEKVISTIAGAGTGKSSTMVARIRHLIEIGVPADSILALSFTNESASEFQTKVEDLCGFRGHQVTVGTFHAIFNKLLRVYSKHEFMVEKLKYDSFFIIDSDDQKKIFHEVTKSLRPQEQALQEAWALERKQFFSELSQHRARAKNAKIYQNSITKEHPNALAEMQVFYKEVLSLAPEDVHDFARSKRYESPALRELMLCKLWNSYTKRCKSNNAMDFDDVLLNTYFLLKVNPDVARKVAARYKHLLVDEFQDSNLIQFLIIKTLMEANPDLNLFFVGDPRQSIYGFRASDVALMLNAEYFFGDVTTLELDTNYRSSNELLSFTNMFAEDMTGQVTSGQLKTGVFHPNIMGHPIEISAHRDQNDEAEFTLNKIDEYLNKGLEPKDIYVLYRTRAGVKAFEELLKSRGVAYNMIGEINFWERAEVKDIASYIRILARPKDVLAYARVLDAVKIGVADMWLRDMYHQNNGEIAPRDLILSRKTKSNSAKNEKIDTFFSQIDLLKRCFDDQEIMVEFVDEMFPEASVEQIQHYVQTQSDYNRDFQNYRHSFIGEAAQHLLDSYLDMVMPQWEKEVERTETKKDSDIPLEERIADKISAKTEHVTTVVVKLAERLILGDSIVDIADDLMTRVSVKQESDKNAINLMTGHASKGLESKVVFMLANENEIFHPNANEINFEACMSPDLDVNDELAEAQRLFYVMMTRATSNLHLSYAQTRVVNGMSGRREPLTMLTKLVDKFKSNVPHWESILKIEHYPMRQHQPFSQAQHQSTPPASTVQNGIQTKGNKITDRLNNVDNSDGGDRMPKKPLEYNNEVESQANEMMKSMGFSL